MSKCQLCSVWYPPGADLVLLVCYDCYMDLKDKRTPDMYNKKISDAVRIVADFTVDGLVEITISVPEDKLPYVEDKHFEQIVDFMLKWFKGFNREVWVGTQKEIQKKKGKTT